MMFATSAALALSMATFPQEPSSPIDPDKIWKGPDLHKTCVDTIKSLKHPYFKRVVGAIERDGYTFRIPSETDRANLRITPTVYAVTNTPTKTVWLIKENIGSSRDIFFEIFANEGAHIIIKPETYPSFSEEGGKKFLLEFKEGKRKEDFEEVMKAITHETVSFLPSYLIIEESRGRPVKNTDDLAPIVDVFFKVATYQVLSRVFSKTVFDKLNSVPPSDSLEGYFVSQMVEYANSGRVKADVLSDLKKLGFREIAVDKHSIVFNVYDSYFKPDAWGSSSSGYAAYDPDDPLVWKGYNFMGFSRPL